MVFRFEWGERLVADPGADRVPGPGGLDGEDQRQRRMAVRRHRSWPGDGHEVWMCRCPARRVDHERGLLLALAPEGGAEPDRRDEAADEDERGHHQVLAAGGAVEGEDRRVGRGWERVV